jgi:hypothetical protein
LECAFSRLRNVKLRDNWLTLKLVMSHMAE